MSAIPNVPEEISNVSTTNADAALLHSLKTKEGADDGGDAYGSSKSQTNGTSNTIPWLMHDTPVENLRPIKVIVIGAGYSGIYLGIRIPERLRNCELVIYEKNDGVAGTWYENRYPGAACDIPSHSYQFSFNPKPDWSALYAPSWEIREYIESTVKKYHVDRFVKLRHEVTECTWSQEDGKWRVKVRKPDGEIFEDSCDVLVSARGNLNDKQWPDIDGLRSFRGELMHSAAWNENYDFNNKQIGIIGSGSSAIQILPKLQKQPGAQLRCFIRSPTWISPPFGQRIQDEMGMGDKLDFKDEQIGKFKSDPEAWYDFRMKVEADSNSVHALTLRGTEMQIGAQKAFEDGMRQRLQKKPEYFDWLKPNFVPGCRRLTPGPGFLEALVEDNVDFVKGEISRVEPQGVVTADEKLHKIDVLVCATGFRASAAPPFEVTGLNGHTMRQHWHDRATNYLSLATDQFPNLFFMLGPNGAIAEGSLLIMIERTGDYILKAIRKIQKDNIKSMVVKPARVRDFGNYCDNYFKGTVFIDNCKTWYRKNGQGVTGDVVTGLWPGSTLHCVESLRSPRWEDYEYDYQPEENGAEVNQLAWLGNGWAVNQLADKPRTVDMAFYLTPMFQEREIGVPVHPKPEDNEQYRIRPWSY